MTKRDHLVRAGVAAMAIGMAGAPVLASAQQPAPPPYDDGRGAAYGQGYEQPSQAPNGYDAQAGQRPEDRAYQRDLHRWEHDRAAYDYQNCVQKHQRSTVAGAVIGGIAGAVLGSNAAPRWDRGGGAFAGGALGAVAGGAIGSASGPVCPGYGRPYAPAPYYGGAYYGAPVVVAPAPVVVGGPVVYGYAPRWHWYHGYWRRW